MQISMNKPPKVPIALPEEPTLRWADDVDFNMDETISISSEEETGSEYDSEQRTRTKSAQEIWNLDILWSELMNLPDAEKINELILKDDIAGIISINKTTGLLLTSWLGKNGALSVILKEGVPINCTDCFGRTALHLASYAGKHECVKLLLDHGAKVDQKDNIHQVTALHCAAAMGHLSCVKLLIKQGADVNAGIDHMSPLHYAVQSSAVDCVKELLENDATPDTPQIFSEAPLHIAASLGNAEIVKLLLGYGAAVNVQCGTDKMTPLHLASEDGDAECARLLIEAGAFVNSKNSRDRTPLHLAALSQCSETLELLLGKRADPNAADTDGRTPLHSAIVKVSRSCECVKLLLIAGANVNKQDSFGYTPLHLAALNEFSHCVMLLINYGGDVTIRTNGGISVLTFITRKTPDVIPKYVDKFDSSINLADHELGDVDCELKLDFRILVPTMGNKETELLLNFIEVGYKDVLKHPLCETFLFLKWRRIRKFFLFSLFYHSIFVFLFTIYVIGVYLKDCPSARSATSLCWVSNYIKNIGYFLICLNILLLGKELFQIAHSWVIYVKQWENWLQWMIIISVFCCVQPIPDMDVELDVYEWQHHVAAISIFLSWVELMMIVGRFPIFGLYVQMFTTVSVNFGKFMLAYTCLFVAFALAFGVIFADYQAFKDLKWVILKVIIMLSGELEYEDVFFRDGEISVKYPYTAHMMYLCFVLLMTIILNNLMVGLAVSDIQGLQMSAGLDRLVRQAELVAHLESMLFSKLLWFMPQKLMRFFHNQALLLKSKYRWALYIKPNDPREERIPKELIKNIYRLVVERKERPRSKRIKKYKQYQFDTTVSPNLSRIGSYNSGANVNINNVVKMQLDEINKEFMEYSKFFRQRMEKLSQQMGNNPKL